MKVLWITNILFPEAKNLLSGSHNESNDSGGWLLGSAEMLIANGIELVVASVSPNVKQLTRLKGEQIVYYVLPCHNERKYHKEYEDMWRDIVLREKPEFAHIHGTEFAHGLAFLRAHTELETVLSLQGIMSAIGENYLCGLTAKEIYSNLTIFDFFYGGSLYKKQRKVCQYAKQIETEYFRRADIIVGRTSFDKKRVLSVVPKADYRVCNESLREPFYEEDNWEYSKCKPFSIFLSQASYPLKGLHQVIKAVGIIEDEYPEIQVRVAGPDVTNNRGLKAKLLRSSYSKLISKLLEEYRLREHFTFLGPLNAQQMKREYLSANVFVCPSSMENSPNSLCEAQILGVPFIASKSGGIPDMIIPSCMDCTYRYDDYYSLAFLLRKAFTHSIVPSVEMRKVAMIRHDRLSNFSSLLTIYNSIKDLK